MYSNSSNSSSEVQTPTSPQIDSNQASPTSPLSYWGASNISRQPRQIRTPRAPLYVPAVLRPTEKPTKASSPSIQRTATYLSDATTAGSASTIVSKPDQPVLRRMVTEEWLDDFRDMIVGPPSRNHWKPDPSAEACDSPTCEREFGLLIRRHHCRRCGSIFCAEHSPHFVPLDHHARFHPMAQRYRACDDCFRDFQLWDEDRQKRLDSKIGDSNTTVTDANKATISVATKTLQPGSNAAPLAQSVPSNWNWSTF